MSQELWGRLVYDADPAEGAVKFTPEFRRQHAAIQLDVLQDWLADLTNAYNEIHAETYKPKAEDAQ